MKRLIFFCSILMMHFLCGTAVHAAIEPLVNVDTVGLDDHQTFEEHLKELKSVDQSSLTRTERKQLRKEIRPVRKQINGAKQGGGLLIAITPLAVVVTLLILFL